MKETVKTKKQIGIIHELIIAGASLLLLGIAYNVFLLRNDLNLGGFTGFAQSFSKMGFHYTVTLFVLNIIPFGIALKRAITATIWYISKRRCSCSPSCGKCTDEKCKDNDLAGKWHFFAASFAMTILFGLCMDLFPQIDLRLPYHVSLVIGSLLGGLGFGLICWINASSGGSDMIGKLISGSMQERAKKMKARGKKAIVLSVGTIMIIIDLFAIILWKIIVPESNFFMSCIAMLLCNFMIDFGDCGCNLLKTVDKYAWVGKLLSKVICVTGRRMRSRNTGIITLYKISETALILACLATIRLKHCIVSSYQQYYHPVNKVNARRVWSRFIYGNQVRCGHRFRNNLSSNTGAMQTLVLETC